MYSPKVGFSVMFHECSMINLICECSKMNFTRFLQPLQTQIYISVDLKRSHHRGRIFQTFFIDVLTCLWFDQLFEILPYFFIPVKKKFICFLSKHKKRIHFHACSKTSQLRQDNDIVYSMYLFIPYTCTSAQNRPGLFIPTRMSGITGFSGLLSLNAKLDSFRYGAKGLIFPRPNQYRAERLGRQIPNIRCR